MKTGDDRVTKYRVVFATNWCRGKAVLPTVSIYIYCSRNMVFKGKNGSKTEFHGNGLLATLGSNFQEGQN